MEPILSLDFVTLVFYINLLTPSCSGIALETSFLHQSLKRLLLSQIRNDEENLICNQEDVSNLISWEKLTLEQKVMSSSPIVISAWQRDGRAVIYVLWL